MNPLICNLCARKSFRMVCLRQKQDGFSRYYCWNPEWGFDCWPKVESVLEVMFGDDESWRDLIIWPTPPVY